MSRSTSLTKRSAKSSLYSYKDFQILSEYEQIVSKFLSIPDNTVKVKTSAGLLNSANKFWSRIKQNASEIDQYLEAPMMEALEQPPTPIMLKNGVQSIQKMTDLALGASFATKKREEMSKFESEVLQNELEAE